MKALRNFVLFVWVSLEFLLGLTGFTGQYYQQPNFLNSKAGDTLFWGDTILFDSCHQARPICGDSGIIYYVPFNYIAYSQGNCCPWDSLDPGSTWPLTCCIDYDSLLHEYPVNPHWFFFRVDQPGIITIRIWTDVYMYFTCIVWGPFDTPHGACWEGLMGNQNVVYVDKIHSFNSYLEFTINNAQSGKYYLMNIGGYSVSSQTNFVHIVQVNAGQPGAGSLSCDITTHCNIFQLTAQVGACNPQTNTFTLSGEAFFSNPPSTGYLVVWDSATGYSSLYAPPFISPFNYSIPGLPCDNQIHRIYAAFWDSAGCENTLTFQAPVLCPDATIGGGGNICNNGTDSVAINVSITPNVQLPVSFTLGVNGVAQPPVTTSGPFPYIFYTRTPGTYTLLQSSNAQCSGTVGGQAVVSLLPLPAVNLGSDVHVCEGRPVILDAGPGFKKYLWNTDETTQTIQVSQPGIYTVEVQSYNNCWNSDTVGVYFHPSPQPLLIRHN
jgi:hypothetical protein